MVESLKKQAGDHGRENVPGKLVEPGKSNSIRGDATGAVAKVPITKTGQKAIKCFGCEEFGHIKKIGQTRHNKVTFCREKHKPSAAPEEWTGRGTGHPIGYRMHLDHGALRSGASRVGD